MIFVTRSRYTACTAAGLAEPAGRLLLHPARRDPLQDLSLNGSALWLARTSWRHDENLNHVNSRLCAGVVYVCVSWGPWMDARCRARDAPYHRMTSLNVSLLYNPASKIEVNSIYNFRCIEMRSWVNKD